MAMSPEDKVREIVAQTIARLRELHDELPDEVRAYLADTNQNLFSSLRKRLEARDRVEVEKKLARAEKNALKVLRKLKLPTQIDGAYEDESELLFFVKKHPRYLERKGRSITALESDQRKADTALEVLVSVRHVRKGIKERRGFHALRFMGNIEQGPELMEHARRGDKMHKAESAGGQETAKKNVILNERNAKLQAKADELVAEFRSKYPERRLYKSRIYKKVYTWAQAEVKGFNIKEKHIRRIIKIPE